MAREPAIDDFEVQVEGVGTFRFAKRTMRDHMKIEVEYARILDGVQPTAWLATVGQWMAVLRILTVVAPEGWDVDNMDPLDSVTYSKLMKVHEALSDQEAVFRGKPRKSKQGGREEAGEESPVLVSQEVQPATE